MAYVTVTCDDGRMTMRERVSEVQLASEHFRACLAERIWWAVQDAAEQATPREAHGEQPLAA